MKRKFVLINIVLLTVMLSMVAFAEVLEKDMDKLYQNPPGVKKFKSGYVLQKSSVKKIGSKLYESKMVQVVSHAYSKWDIRIDCKNRKLAYGCGIMWDNNDNLINRTKSCASGTFDPFKIPKDKDWKEVVRVFCERYDK